ncbi:MAG TPA: HEAT repeat domain-containing protein [Thermoanaerobaculia bacterium]|nr:HEAT repeat domain-containing protein [Thermoanaerobaculia bacterium]
MKRLALVLLLTTAAAAQNFTDATVTSRDASRGVAAAVREIAGSGSHLVAWKVPLGSNTLICCGGGGGSDCCSGCSLRSSRGFSNYGDSKQRGSGEMLVVIRLTDSRVTRVHAFDAMCSVRGEGTPIHVLTNVDPESSLEYLAAHVSDAADESKMLTIIAQHDSPNVVPLLERFAGTGQPEDVREQAVFWLGVRGGERGFRYLRNLVGSDQSTDLRKKAVFAISQSEAAGAVPELIDLARNSGNRQIRREAIFWLGQKAGEKAANELRRFVDEDPDDDVREHAVFAISQLPKERAVPILIDLARNHKSPRVREKAIFWLVQTGDDRALALIEEILMK